MNLHRVWVRKGKKAKKERKDKLTQPLCPLLLFDVVDSSSVVLFSVIRAVSVSSFLNS